MIYQSKEPGRDLQRIAFESPKVILGCWQLAGGHGVSSELEIHRNLRRASELGLTAFDCADIYTGVEELLGRFLRLLRRDAPELAAQVRIHTKFVPDLDDLATLTKSDVERIIDRSLLRLGLNELHLVQFHWWDLSVRRYVEVLSYLSELQRAGKIRHLGLTNFGPEQVAEFVAAEISIASNQVQYSVLDRRPERSLATLCADHGIKLLCYGTTAGGFLSARYLGAQESSGPLENRSLTKYQLIIDECGGWEMYQRHLTMLAEISRDEGIDVSTLCQRFILSRPGVGAVIVGTRSERHLEANYENVYATLSESALVRTEEALRGLVHVPGEVYELERDREGPHGRIMRYNLNRAG